MSASDERCAYVDPRCVGPCNAFAGEHGAWSHAFVPPPPAAAKCKDCGTSLNCGEAQAFTVCGECRAKAHPQAPPTAVAQSEPGYGQSCIHGSLARQCELCERDARIAELEARNKELTKQLGVALAGNGAVSVERDRLAARLEEARRIIAESGILGCYVPKSDIAQRIGAFLAATEPKAGER